MSGGDLTDDVLAALLPLLEACTSALRQTCRRLGPDEHQHATRVLELAEELHTTVIDYWAAYMVGDLAADPEDDQSDDDGADDIPS